MLNSNKANDLLTKSVLDWQKESELNKSQLDQTVINEMYMLKDAENKNIKKKNKNSNHRLADAMRPSQIDTNFLSNKDPKDEPSSPSFHLGSQIPELDLGRGGSMANGDITLDLSPIRVKNRIKFGEATPHMSDIASSYKKELKLSLKSAGKDNDDELDSPEIKPTKVGSEVVSPVSPTKLPVSQITPNIKRIEEVDIPEESEEVHYDLPTPTN